MKYDLIAYTIVLAFINFVFVMIVDWYICNRNVKPVYKLEVSSQQRIREIRNSLYTTPVHAILFYFFISNGILETKSESIIGFFITFIIVFLWTEIWHYFFHVLIHFKTLHFIHREHHLSRLTNPWTSLSFSFLEKLIFSIGVFGFLGIISNYYSLSVSGIFFYYLVYFFTNALGHANFEFRNENYYDSVLGKFFNTPTYHALHHARYNKNYGLLTPWLDKFFLTEWEDVSIVQSNVAKNIPLNKLNEKLK